MLNCGFKWLNIGDPFSNKYREMVEYILKNYFDTFGDYDDGSICRVAGEMDLAYHYYPKLITNIDTIQKREKSVRLSIIKKYFIIFEILENINDYFSYKEEIHEYIKSKNYTKLLNNKIKNDEKKIQYTIYMELLRERYEVSRLYINKMNKLQKYKCIGIEPKEENISAQLLEKIKDIEDKITKTPYYEKYVNKLPELNLNTNKIK